jgi:deazaflavin-dependent oxidoreductase (nitroreductase family)
MAVSTDPPEAATPMTTRPGGPALGSRPAPPTGLLRGLLQLPAVLYRANLGFLLGHRFLLLVHTGRRTGRNRQTVLEVVRYDPRNKESVVAAGWGRRTQWLHNVEAGLATEVRTGRDRFQPVHRVLEVDEAADIFRSYLRRNRLIAPVIRRVLGSLLGWRFDGSSTAIRTAAEQLPFVAFRPLGGGEE